MDALLADRAEQEAGEAAVPARSDDEEVAGGRCLDEHLRGGTLDYLAFDFDALGFGSDVGDGPFEQALGRSVEIVQVDSERGVGTNRAAPIGVAFDAAADVAERPGVDGPHERVPQTRLGECPAQRRL